MEAMLILLPSLRPGTRTKAGKQYRESMSSDQVTAGHSVLLKSQKKSLDCGLCSISTILSISFSVLVRYKFLKHTHIVHEQTLVAKGSISMQEHAEKRENPYSQPFSDMMTGTMCLLFMYMHMFVHMYVL